MGWEHGGVDFQSRFDKSTAQAEEMKEGARSAFCDYWKPADSNEEGNP
jgi:hypothetical protein